MIFRKKKKKKKICKLICARTIRMELKDNFELSFEKRYCGNLPPLVVVVSIHCAFKIMLRK